MTEERPPAADLLRLAMAYQASAALHAAVRLGIADALDGGPQSVPGIVEAIGGDVHAPALKRLLRALVALGVLEEAPSGTFALSAVGRTLPAGNPGSLRDLVLFFGHADMWRSWMELERCIRTGQTAGMLLFGSEDAFVRGADLAKGGKARLERWLGAVGAGCRVRFSNGCWSTSSPARRRG
uniref:methyltransferase family protein n=1 Tax=Falsiroseomonas oryzae TaxID=2766473 RepID=UPI0022EAD470